MKTIFNSAALMAVPITVLAFGIGILQWHGVAFWAGAAGPETGWAVSLALELAALWLWFQRRFFTRALGALATVLLLAGPLYALSAPVLAEWQMLTGRAQSDRAEAALLSGEIASLEKSLAIYLDNSKTRLGWFGSITESEQALQTRRARLRQISSNSPASASGRLPLQRWGIIALQGGALVLFQLVNVLAILALSAHAAELKRNSETEPAPPKTEIPPKIETAELTPVSGLKQQTESLGKTETLGPTETLGKAETLGPAETVQPTETPFQKPPPMDEHTRRRLAKTLHSKVKDSGLSGNAWCDANDVSRRDLSHLLNGKAITAPMLADLARRFLTDAQSATGGPR